jgi:hypothetical protein
MKHKAVYFWMGMDGRMLFSVVVVSRGEETRRDQRR